MSQTAITEQGAARLGMLADPGLKDTISFAAETVIPFGRFVVRGASGEKQCKLPAAAADVTDSKKGLGVAMAQQTLEVPFPTNTNPAQYVKDFTVSVLTFGRVWVLVEEATADETKDVYVRHTAAGALDVIGGFASTSGTGKSTLSNAKFMGASVVIDNLRLIQLQLRLT